MTTFDLYARYYNLFYRDKDYTGEARYISRLLECHCPGARSILEFGCGTGRHAAELAGLGFRVHGVDLSPEMISRARRLFAETPDAHQARLSCETGDLRKLRLPECFDAVISLFHVMSYQITYRDLCAGFTTARHHLKPDGILLFDCWYGPAVLADPPVLRVKVLEDKQYKITRIAEPFIHSGLNRVDVNYRLIVTDKSTHLTTEIEETHKVRYWFLPEIIEFLDRTGFELLSCNAWLTDTPADMNSWNALFTARAMGHHP